MVLQITAPTHSHTHTQKGNQISLEIRPHQSDNLNTDFSYLIIALFPPGPINLINYLKLCLQTFERLVIGTRKNYKIVWCRSRTVERLISLIRETQILILNLLSAPLASSVCKLLKGWLTWDWGRLFGTRKKPTKLHDVVQEWLRDREVVKCTERHLILNSSCSLSSRLAAVVLWWFKTYSSHVIVTFPRVCLYRGKCIWTIGSICSIL